MGTVTLHTPCTCNNCGFYNFNVQGAVYNGNRNRTRIEVRCMRCGKVQTLIDEKTENRA